jgi:cytochrome c2
MLSQVRLRGARSCSGHRHGYRRKDRVQAGRQVFEQRCRNCHGGTAAADYPIGPSLSGIIGTKAGTQDSGMHSRAIMDSGIVWNRESLRRFLSNPQREIPGGLMFVRSDRRRGAREPARLPRIASLTLRNRPNADLSLTT